MKTVNSEIPAQPDKEGFIKRIINKLYTRYRYAFVLLRQLVVADFKIRYHGSFLGYVWTLLRPLALFFILYLVFAKFLQVGGAIPNFPVYLLFGILIWNYFAEVTNSSLESIVNSSDLIRKINFPKYAIIVAGSVGGVINISINFLVIILFMVLTGATPTYELFYLMPLLFLELIVFSLGMSFLLGALFVRFRDIKYVWEVIMQGAFYATPILYPVSLIPESFAKVLLLSPMAQLIQDARRILITPETVTVASIYGEWWMRLIPLSIAVIMVVIGITYFKKRSHQFAENV